MKQKNDDWIVGLKRRHVADVARIEQMCFTQPWSEQAFEYELENSIAVYFVCECETGVKGYIGTLKVVDECHITNVAVHPGWQRQGIARRLLCELEKWARAQKLCMMTLEVREGNAPARAFYESAGFVEMGRRNGYYQFPDEDAILMTKMLEEIEIKLD